MAREDPYPDWTKPATRGEVMQALAHARAITTKLAAVLVAAKRNDDAAWHEAIQAYFREDEEITAFAEQLGGKRGG